MEVRMVAEAGPSSKVGCRMDDEAADGTRSEGGPLFALQAERPGDGVDDLSAVAVEVELLGDGVFVRLEPVKLTSSGPCAGCVKSFSTGRSVHAGLRPGDWVQFEVGHIVRAYFESAGG